jgi:nuclear pore complex protein Nup155
VFEEANRIVDEDSRRDVKKKLDERLYSVSELFNEFATRYALAESALALVKASGHNDPTLIKSLWRTLIDDAYDPSTALEHGEQALSSLIVRLGRDYYPNSVVFPLEHLVATLERLSAEVKSTHGVSWSPFWVADAFVLIGVPFVELYEIYYNLIENPDAFWKGNMPRLFRGFYQVVATWLRALNERDAADMDRRAFREARVDSVIEGILTKLQTMSGHEMETLRNMFKEMQRQVTHRTH